MATKRAMVAALMTSADTSLTMNVKTYFRVRASKCGSASGCSRVVAIASESALALAVSPSSKQPDAVEQARSTIQQAAFWLRVRGAALPASFQTSSPSTSLWAASTQGQDEIVARASMATMLQAGGIADQEIDGNNRRHDSTDNDNTNTNTNASPAATTTATTTATATATARTVANTTVTAATSSTTNAAPAQDDIQHVRARLATVQDENKLLRTALENAMRMYVTAQCESAYVKQDLEAKVVRASDRARRSEATIATLKRSLKLSQSNLEELARTSVTSIARWQRQSESLAAVNERLKVDNDRLRLRLRQHCAHLDWLWQQSIGSSECASDVAVVAIHRGRVARVLARAKPSWFSSSTPISRSDSSFGLQSSSLANDGRSRTRSCVGMGSHNASSMTTTTRRVAHVNAATTTATHTTTTSSAESASTRTSAVGSSRQQQRRVRFKDDDGEDDEEEKHTLESVAVTAAAATPMDVVEEENVRAPQVMTTLARDD
ncbi:hypothetical protein PINS_up013922 [Pythium insidiosum]|nr:hypothetical protein PINS_up013922 [Pythium insidiosum]